MRLRYDRGTIKSYWTFSWPLMLGQGSRVVAVQSLTIAGSHAVGLGGLGALSLSQTISGLADGVDSIVTTTMYPGLCRVADRIEDSLRRRPAPLRLEQ